MQLEMDGILEMVKAHLISKRIFREYSPWTIKLSGLGGRGLFANRNINAGEVIFKDSAILVGPRTDPRCDTFCVSCYAKINLYTCSSKCSLPVCSTNCENSSMHKAECDLINRWRRGRDLGSGTELFRCLIVIRALLLNEFGKKCLNFLQCHQQVSSIGLLEKLQLDIGEEEENTLNFVSLVLDTNAFEVVIENDVADMVNLRAVYPLASFMNHNCVPNTMHVFDSQKNIVIKATRLIQKGEEIFDSYVKLLWGSSTRIPYLRRTKHFTCNCKRCSDPTEHGTNLSAIYCFSCRGLVLPIMLKDGKIVWKCLSCKRLLPADKINIIMAMLGNQLKDLSECNPQESLKFLSTTLLKHVPPCNQVALQLKSQLVWILGHRVGFLWVDLSMELLDEKQKICLEILEILQKLGAGKNKMRGLLLYELYCCLKERHRRMQTGEELRKDLSEEMAQLFEESRLILMDDVHAPKEIKQYNKTNN